MHDVELSHMQDVEPDPSRWIDGDGFANQRAWRVFFAALGLLSLITLVTAALHLFFIAFPMLIIAALVVLIVPSLLTLCEPTL